MTEVEKKVETKSKILKTANQLFALKGFEGTSIREIAQKAEVNLAAINYHFKSKERLYWAIFDYNYEIINDEIERIGLKKLSTPHLTKEVFRFFISSGTAMMNTVKVFLSGRPNAD